MFLCYLSFYRSTHLRYLHSFPTRRSSDLPLLSAIGFDFKTSDPMDVSCMLRRPERITLAEVTVLPGNVLSSPSSSDRKSTRLNSSHLVISYAVFCLKKKIKYNVQDDGVDN